MSALLRLVLFNLGARAIELAQCGRLIGDALIDRVRHRWQAPQQKVSR